MTSRDWISRVVVKIDSPQRRAVVWTQLTPLNISTINLLETCCFLCVAGTWFTAATRCRAPRRRSTCGFASMNCRTGRTAATAGSTVNAQPLLQCFIDANTRCITASSSGLVACGLIREEVSSVLPYQWSSGVLYHLNIYSCLQFEAIIMTCGAMQVLYCFVRDKQVHMVLASMSYQLN